jgi:haloalkane dehalogenase
VLELRRYSLVVHDYGGPFALHAALDAPERLDRLVIYNSFAWAYGDSPETKRLAALAGSGLFRWLYRNVNFSFWIAKSAWGDRKSNNEQTWAPYLPVFREKDAREQVLFALARAMQGSAPFCDSLWQRLDRLRDVAVHIIWGMKDTAFPPSALARFQSALPHASVLRLETAGHFPHEEQPSRTVASVKDFLLPPAHGLHRV